jgi:hypothetical protein
MQIQQHSRVAGLAAASGGMRRSLWAPTAAAPAGGRRLAVAWAKSSPGRQRQATVHVGPVTTNHCCSPPSNCTSGAWGCQLSALAPPLASVSQLRPAQASLASNAAAVAAVALAALPASVAVDAWLDRWAGTVFARLAGAGFSDCPPTPRRTPPQGHGAHRARRKRADAGGDAAVRVAAARGLGGAAGAGRRPARRAGGPPDLRPAPQGGRAVAGSPGARCLAQAGPPSAPT